MHMLKRPFSWMVEVWEDMEGEVRCLVVLVTGVIILAVATVAFLNYSEATENQYEWAKSWIGYYEEYDQQLSSYMQDGKLTNGEVISLERLIGRMAIKQKRQSIRQQIIESIEVRP